MSVSTCISNFRGYSSTGHTFAGPYSRHDREQLWTWPPVEDLAECALWGWFEDWERPRIEEGAVLIIEGPGLPDCNAPGQEALEIFENWLACGEARWTLIPWVRHRPPRWSDVKSVAVDFLRSAALRCCRKIECGVIQPPAINLWSSRCFEIWVGHGWHMSSGLQSLS